MLLKGKRGSGSAGYQSIRERDRRIIAQANNRQSAWGWAPHRRNWMETSMKRKGKQEARRF